MSDNKKAQSNAVSLKYDPPREISMPDYWYQTSDTKSYSITCGTPAKQEDSETREKLKQALQNLSLS